MEPMELLLKLENIKEIWTGYAHLDLDKEGRPVLSGWYNLTENTESIKAEYIIESIIPLIWRKVN